MLFFFEISTKKFYFDFWQTQLLLFYKSKLLFINPNKLLTSLNSYEKNDSNISIISLNLLLQLYYIYNIYYKYYISYYNLSSFAISIVSYFILSFLNNLLYFAHTYTHTCAGACVCTKILY